MTIVRKNSSLLKKVSTEVESVESVEKVIDLLLHNASVVKGCIGLAGVQVGAPVRVILCKFKRTNEFTVCINPRVIFKFGLKGSIESCASSGDEEYLVWRADKLLVTYTDDLGDKQYKFLTGLDARIFQHEVDHLNGVCIWEKGTKVND